MLREAYDYQDQRAKAVCQKNPEVHAEMDEIRRQKDQLSKEIEKLTANPADLQANFEKFVMRLTSEPNRNRR